MRQLAPYARETGRICWLIDGSPPPSDVDRYEEPADAERERDRLRLEPGSALPLEKSPTDERDHDERYPERG
jgi:hypothetical protein